MTEGKTTAIIVAGLVALSAFIAMTSSKPVDEAKSSYVTKAYECTHVNTRMYESAPMNTVERPSAFSVAYDENDKTKAVVQFNFSSIQNKAPARYLESTDKWQATVKDGNSYSTIEIALGEYPSASFTAENGFEVHAITNSCMVVEQLFTRPTGFIELSCHLVKGDNLTIWRIL